MKSPKLLLAAGIGIILLYAVYTASAGSFSTGASELAWKSFDDGVSLAKTSDKKILIDVYTDWCSWCKKMDAEVYADANIRRALEKDFVVIKVNAESNNKLTFDGKTMTEAEFAQSAGVTGYPTTLFMTADAKPITLLPGYVKTDMMTNVLSFISGDHYQHGSFQDYVGQNK